jgi:GNAT superfamily N-acetyltransferase
MTTDFVAAIERHRIDLFFLEGTLVALIEMVPNEDHLLIENVAISPASQRKGLGRKLIAHAEGIAADLGHTEVRLYTNTSFCGNIRFYQNLGYRIYREETWAGGRVVHFIKQLDGKCRVVEPPALK